jgi:membrane associated rhomboid family serine protease
VGASGAIYGILFAYAYYFPNQPIYLYFFIPVKAKYLMAGLILIDLFSGLTGGGDVAHFAHLGGVLSGWLFLNVYRLKRINRRF